MLHNFKELPGNIASKDKFGVIVMLANNIVNIGALSNSPFCPVFPLCAL